MKYFIDTEFHEYAKQPTVCGVKVGKHIDTIELISIGIVSEDIIKDGYVKGIDATIIQKENQQLPACDKWEYAVVPRNYGSKKYYAICKDFDLKAAWNNEWLRENVLKSIWVELKAKDCKSLEDRIYYNSTKEKIISYLDISTDRQKFKEFKKLINKYGKTREQIAEEIEEFVNTFNTSNGIRNNLTDHNIDVDYPRTASFGKARPEFYAYYADYDWVVFCWLFGRMIDLPDGFPMYCIDLKQELDRKVNLIVSKTLDEVCSNGIRNHPKEIFTEELSLKYKLGHIKAYHKEYPKQTNEHNALADAKWNKELYNFINTL